MASNLYESIDQHSRDIRLVKLHPSIQQSSAISCTLLRESLENPPTYSALSYVWGDIRDTVPLTVSGYELHVTKNLQAALKRLRQPENTLLLWVDSICINQSNIPERNHQVGQMRDIYRSAVKVLVWLGEERDNSVQGMQLVEALSKDYLLYERLDGQGNKPGAESVLEYSISSLLGQHDNVRGWKALNSILERPYWRRVWVYQEFVVARDIVIMCGPQQMSSAAFAHAFLQWDKMKRAVLATDLGPIQDSINSEFLDGSEAPMIKFISHQLYLSGNYDNIGPGYDLPSLVLSSVHLNSTDPRDKVFALLGVDDVRDIPIEPKYEQSPAEIYTDFAWKIVKYKRELDFLCYAGIGVPQALPMLDIPSWVPDLRMDEVRCRYNNFQTVPRPSKYSASGQSEAVIHFVDNRVLKVSGIIAASISQVVGAGDVVGVAPDWAKINSWRVATCQDQRDAAYPTGVTMWQAFFRTMIADGSGHGGGPADFVDTNDAEDFYDLARGFMLWWGVGCPNYQQTAQVLQEHNLSGFAAAFAAWDGSVPDGESLTDETLLEPFLGRQDSVKRLPWPEKEIVSINNTWLTKYWQRHQDVFAGGKAYFFTQNGFIGLGPHNLQRDDVICVIPGCGMPVVLRAVKAHYELVGSCYVYGMMKGEIMKATRDGMPKDQVLEIW
ncbi:heterokaryon incompatibility protein-domain-containing protein [Hyaloscypha sp. PMI_1271]|nr:heterokaryon incompatibility protein-domain-containing protein [Hyaloscypha sp. PMI_1271]